MVYARNADLRREIHLSKSSYCEFDEPHYRDYDLIVTSLGDPAILEKRLELQREPIVRLMTRDHIPDDAGTLSFKPFAHFEGNREVGRSHSRDGAFCASHGRITPALGQMMVKIVTGMAKKGNWNGYSFLDDMRAEALLNLSINALKFDEAKSDNAFAYLSMAVHNSFLKQLRGEKKQHAIRDDLLHAAGQPTSFAFADRVR